MTNQLQIVSPKIFISYAWENQATTRQLQQALIAAGAEVFVDYTGIQGGDNLPTRISQALRWCDTLILLWSQPAAGSHWVELEWTSALALKRHLIPCKLDETPLPEILCSKRYVDLKNYDYALNDLLAALRLKIPTTMISELKSVSPIQLPIIQLRAYLMHKLSGEEVKAMLKRYDFYCSEYSWSRDWCNPTGKGIKHSYKLQHNGKVVVDHSTGLIWQQSGSSNYMTFADAETFVRDLNRQHFAGYKDWRLPTLEEAMSLMEYERKNGGLYIATLFDQIQFWIWTADKYIVSGRVWHTHFLDGRCTHVDADGNSCVRAVRVGQSII